MRLLHITVVLVVFGCLLSSSFGQEEDSAAPKRVLKKYRVRRPVIVDEQGNVVRAGPRLRRVRVKKPETAALLQGSPAPEQLQQAQPVRVLQATTPATQAPRILQEQGQREVTPTRQRVRVQTTPPPTPVQPQQPLLQQQNFAYEEQGIVEPLRTVTNIRQPTSSANREALLANVKYRQRGGTQNSVEGEEERKQGTVRNYSRINEDGSFTFGYEAVDGSFKEETRGTDCVVRGKYGYIDPEGVRREFEYVSGNPCDPNAQEEETSAEEDEEALPPPTRQLIRQRVRPQELADNNVQQGLQQVVEERLPEDQFVRPVQRQRVRPTQQSTTSTFPAFNQVRQRVRITTPPPPAYTPSTPEPALIVRQRQPSPSSYFNAAEEPSQSLESDIRGGRAFNFDSEVQRIAAISRPASQPQPLYEQPFRIVQQGRSVEASPAPSRAGPTAQQNAITNPAFGRYRTELVYDRNSGQYNSVVVQSNANNNQEFELTQKLRAFVEPTQQSLTNSGNGGFTQFQQFGQPQVQYYHGNQQQQQQQAQPVQQQRIHSPPSQQQPQDPSQINQFLARHAYRVQNEGQQVQQPQPQPQNLQFIPHHLRPNQHQTAEIQQQEVREIPAPRIQSGNSAAAANGQIDAFLRALNISI